MLDLIGSWASNISKAIGQPPEGRVLKMSWFPIKTAPKEKKQGIVCKGKNWGPLILAWKTNPRTGLSYFGDPYESDDYSFAEENPATHWHPISPLIEDKMKFHIGPGPKCAKDMAWETILADTALDTHAHLPFLYETAKGNILEIGVHCGISTTAFLAGLETQGGHLYSIDVHPSCRYVHYGHPQWTFYCTWSGDEPKPELPLDVLFVDGDHFYPEVLNDLKTWGPKVRPGGLILCHDADTPSFPGVRLAIDEYCAEHNLKHELRKGSHGLEVIYA